LQSKARGTRNNSKNETVKDYTLVMEVSQHSKDEFILTSIQNYFGVGKVYQEIRGITKFRLVVREEIIQILAPHFAEHPLDGNKLLQYNIRIKILQLLKNNSRGRYALKGERSIEIEKKIGILI
jgi:hypothetical protein